MANRPVTAVFGADWGQKAGVDGSDDLLEEAVKRATSEPEVRNKTTRVMGR